VKNLGPAIKVGITVIIAVVLGYWATMMLAKGSCGGKEENLVVHAYFADATNLVEKSRVQIAGLHMGHLVSKELNVQPPRQELIDQRRFAKITVALDKQVILYRNARIFKKSASLLGEFYLEIDPGTADYTDAAGKRHKDDRIKSGDEIKIVIEGVTTEQVIRQTEKLFKQMNEVIPTLNRIAGDIRAFTKPNGPLSSITKNIDDGISENRDTIKKTLANIAQITQDVRKITRGADKNVEGILVDIKQITSAVRSLVGKGDKEVEATAGKVKSSLDKLASAIDKLDNALGNMQDITAGVQKGEGTVGRLLKDEQLVDDVESVVKDASGFVRSLTGLQTIVGLRSEYNFKANSIKTYASIEIHPRPDKYYLIELIDDPRGARTVTTRQTRSDDPTKPALTREEFVEVTDAFRFSFMFAKRISLATFRFGIKESTGGIGFDLQVWKDRLRLETDVFDFSSNIWPRMKLLAAFEFFKRLYVVGGVDDVLNDRPLDGTGGGRDYFAGMQLRFNDEDLKALLLFGGSAIGGASK
jgi:phospholipid/cholesterol/gamma-HCH transport system substrate-binding protein